MIQEAGRKRRDAASPRSSSFSSSALGCGTWPPPAPAAISHLKGGGGRSDGSRMEELTSCWKPLTELDPSEAHTHSCSDSPGSWRLTDSTMTHVALEVKQVRKKTHLIFSFRGCQLSMTAIWGEPVSLFLIYFLKSVDFMAEKYLFESTQWGSLLGEKKGKYPRRFPDIRLTAVFWVMDSREIRK